MLLDKGFKNWQKGAVMVEFAIVVPLLLLVVIGIVEIGYGFYHLNILNKSVEDGARYFSDSRMARFNGAGASRNYPINVSSANTYVAKARNLVIYGNVAGTCDADPLVPCPLMPNAASYTPVPAITCVDASGQDTACSSATQHIKVTATYRHNFILGTAAGNFISALGTTGSINLTASTVLRVE